MKMKHCLVFGLTIIFLLSCVLDAAPSRSSTSSSRPQRSAVRPVSRGMQRPIRSSATRQPYVRRSVGFRVPSKKLNLSTSKTSKTTQKASTTAAKTTSTTTNSTAKSSSKTTSAATSKAPSTAKTTATKAVTTTTVTTTTTGSSTTSVTVTTQAGGGVVVGTSLKHLGHPHHRYWGRRYFYATLGWWYYPWSGSWYYDDWGCWYYPGSRSWFFHRGWCWYYPHHHFSIYLASEPKRIVFVENDEDEDLFYAVYSRYKVGNEYYLYRVNEPQVMIERKTVKVELPRRKSSEYVVLADRNKDQLPSTVHQKASGDVEKTADVGIRANEQQLTEDAADIKVNDLSKKDKRTLKKLKKEVDKRKKQLAAAEKKINKVKKEDIVSEPEETT